MADTATDKAKWTVMVYMAAGDDAELDAHAVSDLQEMERAGVGPDINVVVQIDRFWPALGQRYRISRDGTELVEGTVVDRVAVLGQDPVDGQLVVQHGSNVGARRSRLVATARDRVHRLGERDVHHARGRPARRRHRRRDPRRRPA